MIAGNSTMNTTLFFLALNSFLSTSALTDFRAHDDITVENIEVLWQQGDHNIGCYRIPIISYTPNRSLLIFAEARRYSCNDEAKKFIIMRKSIDKDSAYEMDGFNLGSVVVDDYIKRIFLLYVHCAHYILCDVSTSFLIYSDNDGESWSLPVNISEKIGTKMFAPGPGNGIQKKLEPHKGRLIVCGHSTLEANGIFCLLSDDHGENWRYGGSVYSIPYNEEKQLFDFSPDENQAVELSDGSVMVNARNQDRFHCPCRIVARSYDAAETFLLNNLRIESQLTEPKCAAGFISSRGILYFSNPEYPYERKRFRLKWSTDEGTTWSHGAKIDPWCRFAGYSHMTTIPTDEDDIIYIVYENGNFSSVDQISLATVRVSEYLHNQYVNNY